MNMDEKILKAINYSRLLRGLIADERKALESGNEEAIIKFTDEKMQISQKITALLTDIVDNRGDLNADESRNFRDLVLLNEKNQKNNKINGAIISGLISSNKILLSAITGTTISEVYGQSGKLPTDPSNNDLAQA